MPGKLLHLRPCIRHCIYSQSRCHLPRGRTCVQDTQCNGMHCHCHGNLRMFLPGVVRIVSKYRPGSDSPCHALCHANATYCSVCPALHATHATHSCTQMSESLSVALANTMAFECTCLLVPAAHLPGRDDRKQTLPRPRNFLPAQVHIVNKRVHALPCSACTLPCRTPRTPAPRHPPLGRKTLSYVMG